jgi:hypothetical protein
MGQYFKFTNTTTGEESKIPLPFNFGLPWAKNLVTASQEEIKEVFDFVVKNNNWEETDEVIVTGDYGETIYYPKGFNSPK